MAVVVAACFLEGAAVAQACVGPELAGALEAALALAAGRSHGAAADGARARPSGGSPSARRAGRGGFVRGPASSAASAEVPLATTVKARRRPRRRRELLVRAHPPGFQQRTAPAPGPRGPRPQDRFSSTPPARLRRRSSARRGNRRAGRLPPAIVAPTADGSIRAPSSASTSSSSSASARIRPFPSVPINPSRTASPTARSFAAPPPLPHTLSSCARETSVRASARTNKVTRR